MIVLLRHAPAQGVQGRYIGHTDPPLSDEGLCMVRSLAESALVLPPEQAPTALYCSSLTRSRDTATPLAENLGLIPMVLDGLAEIDLGKWDGRLIDNIRHEEPEAHAARGCDFAGFRPPGGENFTDVLTRAKDALMTMAQGPRPALAVTHAGVIRVLTCHALGIPLGNIFRLRPEHCRATVLALNGNKVLIQAFNTTWP